MASALNNYTGSEKAVPEPSIESSLERSHEDSSILANAHDMLLTVSKLVLSLFINFHFLAR